MGRWSGVCGTSGDMRLFTIPVHTGGSVRGVHTAYTYGAMPVIYVHTKVPRYERIKPGIG